MGRLSNKIAMITGGSSGIGRAIAKKYAMEGVNLIITSRRREVLEEIKKEYEKEYGVDVYVLVQDVSNSEDVRKGVEGLPEKWKEIDILVNNAGLALGLDKIHESAMESFDKVMDTNVKGMLYVSRCVIPLMVKRNKGHIINIGSTAGHGAYPGGGVYCASKSAVRTLTDGIRIDLVDTNIRVTNVQPGLVETNFSKIRFNGDEKRAENTYKGIEALTGDDVAEVVFMASNLPENVQIGEVTVMPNHQATGTYTHKTL